MHQLKSVNHEGVVVKCGTLVSRKDASVWSSDVDCPRCNGSKPVQEQELAPKVMRRRHSRRA